MTKFNVGVLGIGDISDVYIQNLKKYEIVHVAACASRNLEKARKKADQHQIEKAYATAEELIEDPEIDIILNLTVPAVHAELTVKALEAGKHVYTEKPLAAALEDGKKILDLAKEKGLYVGCAPDTFLGGRLQTCRKLIDEGTIGDIVGASAFVAYHGTESFHPNPDFFYKPGGGPLLDIGPYYITALLSLIGPVRSCSAMAKRTFDKRIIESEPRQGDVIEVEVETHITGTLQFANNALATFIMSFDVWDSELPRLEIYGTKGTICINDIDPLDGPNLFGGPILLKTKEQYRWKAMPRQKPLSRWEEVPIIHPFNETSHQENSRGIGLIDMAYAIRDKRVERASGQMAFHSLEVMEGLLKSAKEGQFYHVKSNFNRPHPLPIHFPQSEG
ncbi:Gfo/Idh/MocA family oxidoreductase [Domibacillus indicus]|uniref:Gfo/Idh/MocA family protein n=1 Tax=Domibacillus indicus TaxID=1437523 RepID=UPI00203AA65A|nr:Gfo/Idh/MocA family oxidoreductase [Domibacillus indicus]MCM3791342.1 Gfo/Idh/MocA family oxidoreductase [Domibacillus indicus]